MKHAMARTFVGLAALASAIMSPVATADAQDPSLDTVAAAVRQKGFACANPVSVKADAEASTPDERSWIIVCGDTRYRVKFRGDTGTTVEPVD